MMSRDGVPHHRVMPSATRRGFTLIELVVVLLLIALATAVTVPAFLHEDPPQADMDAAEQRVSLLFRLARDSAVHSGAPVTVFLDSITATAWLVTGSSATSSDPASNASRTAGALHATPGESLGLPASVSLGMSSARARFRFMPGGAAFGDTLVLRAGATVRSMTVDPWTGDAVTF